MKKNRLADFAVKKELEACDQPPRPPRTLEQTSLRELYRPVPEDVLPPVTPPQEPAEVPIDIDDEDMQRSSQ